MDEKQIISLLIALGGLLMTIFNPDDTAHIFGPLLVGVGITAFFFFKHIDKNK